MKFRVETLPHYRIAYLRRFGTYGPENSEVMEDLKVWARERNLLSESTILLAIPQDNPETTLSEKCRFDACIVIADDYQIDGSIFEGETSEGKYLIYEVKHITEDIQEAYSKIFLFLQSNEYHIDNRPIIERFIGNMNSNSFCEICVPIK
ncbi:AraC family transcriptional regulator [Bacillus sp. B1-b2]|uniref:AraC family transcriptional regulator n=1 Tax=Bacillus sp. B1-b2 TaxID=2653201 RepID=UPI001261C39C|nr:GyrI-like domain-containing protein [Bacillus sp. B1-b2]KAB7662724.1 DNA gyrase inhibitor [Bacillus sp. B1-b2]